MYALGSLSHPLQLQHPARLATAAGVAAARDGVAELAVRVLRVLLR